MRVHVVTIIFFVWKFYDFVGLGAATTRCLWKKRNNKRPWGFSETICVVTLTEASPHWSNGYGHPLIEPPTHTLNLLLLLIFKRTREGCVLLAWFHCFQARSRQCFCIAYFAKIELKSDKKYQNWPKIFTELLKTCWFQLYRNFLFISEAQVSHTNDVLADCYACSLESCST